MKKRIPLLVVMLVCSLLTGCVKNEEEAAAGAEPLRIVIASDTHYISQQLTDNGLYFQRMMENADGKITEYCEPLMEGFVEQVIEEKPDAVILSGDFSFNGAKLSHEDLAVKLSRIEDAGIPVYVIPGNHDIESGLAYSFCQGTYSKAEETSQKDFEEIYSGFGYCEALNRDEASLSYTVDLNDQVRLLMVDCNTPEEPGLIKTETLAWIEGQLKQAEKDGKYVLAVSHQNLLQHSSVLAYGFVMGNNKKLLKLYEKYPVICNLSGHMHIQHVQKADSGFTEIATSSLSVSPDQYGIMEIKGSTAAYHTEPVDMKKWAAEHNPDLVDFAGMSERYFKRISAEKSLQELDSADNAQEMADWAADINACYFAGRMDQAEWNDALYQEWEKTDSFFGMYLTSLKKEGPVNQNTAVISFAGK